MSSGDARDIIVNVVAGVVHRSHNRTAISCAQWVQIETIQKMSVIKLSESYIKPRASCNQEACVELVHEAFSAGDSKDTTNITNS